MAIACTRDGAPFGEGDTAPVDGPVLTSQGADVAVDTWFDVVTDAVNQAGAQCGLSLDGMRELLKLS